MLSAIMPPWALIPAGEAPSESHFRESGGYSVEYGSPGEPLHISVEECQVYGQALFAPLLNVL
jgi:hypothetical protein